MVIAAPSNLMIGQVVKVNSCKVQFRGRAFRSQGFFDCFRYLLDRQRVMGQIVLPINVQLGVRRERVLKVVTSVSRCAINFTSVRWARLLLARRKTVHLSRMIGLRLFQVLNDGAVSMSLIIAGLSHITQRASAPFSVVLSFVGETVSRVARVHFVRRSNFPSMLFCRVVVVQVLGF